MKLSSFASKVSPLTLSLTLLLTSSATVLAAPVATRSAQNKLEACQARESKVKARMDHAVKQLNKHLGVFEKLQTRVEARYAKVVASGKAVPSYADLLAKTNSAKTSAEAAIAKAKADNFSCTDTDPKSDLATFRADVKAAKKALHDYRLAIKNTNVAISSVTGEKSRSATGSANTKATL